MLTRIVPDRLIWILIGTIIAASLFPVSGDMVRWASFASSAAVFIIFLLHGIRLPRAQVWDGLRNWRIQGAIALFVFGVMPLAGLALARITDGYLPSMVAIGLLYAGVLPTTVQSATTYTNLSRGNVAISVIASAGINLVAIVATPTLFALLAGREAGFTLSSDLGFRIAMILLLPFIIGQSIQRWVRPWALGHTGLLKNIDQSAIAIAVYVAFSAAVIAGIWGRLSLTDFLLLSVAIIAMLLVGFAGAWTMGGLLRLALEDRIAVLFSAAHKSIAVGAPLAALMFPPQAAGMVLLPILIYHLAQLFISSWLAPPLARLADQQPPATGHNIDNRT